MRDRFISSQQYRWDRPHEFTTDEHAMHRTHLVRLLEGTWAGRTRREFSGRARVCDDQQR